MITTAVCGNGKFIEGEENWYTTCTQRPDHDGPHVGFIMWDEGEEPSEDEVPMTVTQVAKRLDVSA